MVSASYDDARFKETLRVSRGTFLYILDAIRPDPERESVGGSPLSTELRLGICLYRLAIGDYYYTIAEMAGIGEATVCTTVIEVCKSIINNLWTSAVASIFPKIENEFREAMITMKEHWQFLCAFGAIYH